MKSMRRNHRAAFKNSVAVAALTARQDPARVDGARWRVSRLARIIHEHFSRDVFGSHRLSSALFVAVLPTYMHVFKQSLRRRVVVLAW
jgi:hypothetical protein